MDEIILNYRKYSCQGNKLKCRGLWRKINPLMTGDSCRSRRYLSTLLQEMAWHQISTKLFLRSMLILYRIELISLLSKITYGLALKTMGKYSENQPSLSMLNTYNCNNMVHTDIHQLNLMTFQ